MYQKLAIANENIDIDFIGVNWLKQIFNQISWRFIEILREVFTCVFSIGFCLFLSLHPILKNPCRLFFSLRILIFIKCVLWAIWIVAWCHASMIAVLFIFFDIHFFLPFWLVGRCFTTKNQRNTWKTTASI